MTLPQDYSLPHDTFRPHQRETIEYLSSFTGQKQNIVLSAPTGSGKSSYVRASASSKRTIVLTKTKSLQFHNYDHIYGMDTLYGKSNYACVHPNGRGNMANLCLYTDVGMNKCSVHHQCPYLIQKNIVVPSNKISLNYAYWLTAQRGWLKGNMPEVLFLDECHLLPALIRDWSGCTIDDYQRSNWKLPEFPVITKGKTTSSGGSGFFTSEVIESDPSIEVINWLEESLKILKDTLTGLLIATRKYQDDKSLKARLHSCESLGMKLRGCLESLQANPTDWYIKSGKDVLSKNYKRIPGLLCKPLTARYHFPRLFLKEEIQNVVMMSATIGKPEQFAKEIGLHNYNLRLVPNVFNAADRPVYVFKDCPRMGYTKDEEGAFDPDRFADKVNKQADLMARFILDYPHHWTGIIHVQSKRKADGLLKALASRGLEDRVCKVPETGTEKQLQWWIERKQVAPGALCITWSFAEGVDLYDDNFCLSADIPFADQGDEYGKARFEYSIPLYMWEAATELEQRMGRIRRGDVSHYGPMAEKVVAIFDSNWTRIKSYLSDDFLESIVEI